MSCSSDFDSTFFSSPAPAGASISILRFLHQLAIRKARFSNGACTPELAMDPLESGLFSIHGHHRCMHFWWTVRQQIADLHRENATLKENIKTLYDDNMHNMEGLRERDQLARALRQTCEDLQARLQKRLLGLLQPPLTLIMLAQPHRSEEQRSEDAVRRANAESRARDLENRLREVEEASRKTTAALRAEVDVSARPHFACFVSGSRSDTEGDAEVRHWNQVHDARL